MPQPTRIDVEAKMAVSEVFGPTIQGEGRSTGATAVFVRLGGCNLACSWCDTPYTWDWTKFDRRKEVRFMTVREVRNKVMNLILNQSNMPRVLVISGGEPMLQQVAIANLWDMLRNTFEHLEIETNGTIAPILNLQLQHRVKFNISPKLTNSGTAHPSSRDISPEWSRIQADVVYKFVIESLDDLREVEGFNTPAERTWVMPQGTTREEQLDPWVTTLAEAAISRGWNFSTRLHTLLWGNKRGK